MRRTLQRLMLAAVIPAALALLPALADAQGRPPGGGGGGGRTPGGAGAPSSGGQPPSAGARPPSGGGSRPAGPPPGGGRYYGGGYYGGGRYGGSVYVGGYYGYPYWGFGWGYPYWGFGWGWGYPYGGYPYPYWGYYDPTPELRLEVKPKEAQVYVDGYFAGVVDDFDGTFQRLRMRPGSHELTIYLKGYHTVTQNIHVGNGQDSKVKYQMEPLAAGEANEPPPQPKNPPEDMDVDVQPGPPRQAPAPRPPAGQAVQESSVQLGQGFGALVIRVQPSGAEVLVDGERWQGPEGAERLVIQVSEGSHRVEVRKDGFVPFSTTVQVRRGETAPLNVSLPPRGE